MAKYSSIEEVRAVKDARAAQRKAEAEAKAAASATPTTPVSTPALDAAVGNTSTTPNKNSHITDTALTSALMASSSTPANLADLGRRGLLDNYLSNVDLSAAGQNMANTSAALAEAAGKVDFAGLEANADAARARYEDQSANKQGLEVMLGLRERRANEAVEAYKANPTKDTWSALQAAIDDHDKYLDDYGRSVSGTINAANEYNAWATGYDNAFKSLRNERGAASAAEQEYRLAYINQHGFNPFVETEDEYNQIKASIDAQLAPLYQRKAEAQIDQGGDYSDLDAQIAELEGMQAKLDEQYAANTYSKVYAEMPEDLKSMLAEVPALMEKRWATTGDGFVPDEQVAAESNARINEIRGALAQAGYTENEIDSLIDREQRTYNAQLTASRQEQEAANAAQRSGAANLINRAIASLASGGGVIDASIQKLFAGTDAFTGQRELVDYNSFWQNPYHTSVAMASGHNQRIMDNMLEKHEGDAEAAEAAAQRRMWMNDLGVSIIQSGLAMGLTPIPGLGMTAGLLLQSGSAATATMHQYHQMGYSDGQAITMGLAAGAIEYVTERIGMENFLRLVRGGYSGTSLWKHILSSVGDQAWTEGKEEGLSNVLNVVTDILVTGDDNAITRARAELMAQNPGMTEQEASKQVFLNKLYDLGKDMFGGAISGGIFGGFGAMTSLAGVASQMDANIEQARAEEEVASRTLSPIRMGKSISAMANQILRNAELLTAYEETFGPLAGKSNTEKVREIAKNLTSAILAERASARETQAAVQEEMAAEEQNQQELDDLAQQILDEVDAETAEQERLSNRSAQQVVIDLLTAGGHASVNRIVSSEENQRAFTELTGVSLEGLSNNKRRDVISDWLKKNDPSQLTVVEQRAAEVEQLVPEHEQNTPLTDTLLGEQSQPVAQQTVEQPSPAITGQRQVLPPVVEEEAEMPDYEPTMRVGKRRTEGEKRSQTNSNSNAAEAEKYGVPEKERQKVYYEPTTEEERYDMARERMADPAAAENHLRNTPNWSGVDVATSDLLLEMKAQKAQETGDWSEYNAWELVDDEHGNKIANALQAFAIRSRFPGKALLKSASKTLRSLELTQERTNEAMARIKPFCDRLDNIKEDATALKQLIWDISNERGTGAFFNRNMRKWLEGRSTEYLKKLAQAQLEALAHDYSPHDAGNMVKSWQTIAQLLKVTTNLRNFGGNDSFGTVDALIGNTLGQALDAAVSGKTGVKAVPVVRRWFNSTYRKAAIEAFNTALLEIALDVDMGSVGNKYDPQTRAFRMNGNPVERFVSRASQLLSYSLTGFDQMAKGGIEGSAQESLEKKNAKAIAEGGVTKEQLSEVGKDIAEYDTFQQDNALSSGAKTIHDFLNLIGVGGTVQNGTRKGGFGLGDVYMPYAKVPVNLGLKPIEMSPAGIVSGGIDLLKVIKNAKSGKVDPKAQNRAIMKIARGMTGVPLAILFATFAKAGVIIGSDDEDYKVTNLRKMEGRYNAQLNVDGALRLLQGGSAEWQEGDTLWSLDWMQPIAAFMEIGLLFSELAEDEDAGLWDYVGAYAQGTIKAFMDMPVVSGLLNLTNDFRYALDDIQNGEFEKKGAVGRAVESVATDALTGLFPGIVANTAKAIDPYQRDTGGDTVAERVGNEIIAGIPFARNSLDVKLDAFGNEMTAGDHNFGNSLIYPGAVNEYVPNNVVTLLDEVYKESGKSNFYPEYKAPTSFTVGGEKLELTHDEQRAYTKASGEVYTELATNAETNRFFAQLTGDQKAAVLSSIKEYSREEAKAQFLEGRDMNLRSDTFRDVLELEDPVAYFCAKAWFTEAAPSDTTYTERDYDAIDANISMFGRLPEDVQNLLDDGQSTSRMADLYEAKQLGIDSAEWYEVYDAYREKYGEEGITAGEKVADLDTWMRSEAPNLNARQRNLLRDQFMYYSQVPGDPKKYDQMIEYEVPSDVANTAYDVINNVEKPDGYESVPAWAKYMEIATSTEIPDEYRDQIMTVYLGGEPEEGENNNVLTRYRLMTDAGFSMRAFALAYQIVSTTKGTPGPNNKTIRGSQRKNTIAALQSAGFKSYSEDLYELFNADAESLKKWNAW